MLFPLLGVLAGVLLMTVLCAGAHAEPLQLPEMTAAQQAVRGAGVQRTMRLLATGTAEAPSRVRILFYGQSITQTAWTERVVDDLRRRFPHSSIDARNRAIGGFASRDLARVAPHDVLPFYPDLVILHVYGAQDGYEEILRLIRRHTTAEILIQTDHLTRWPTPDATEESDKDAWWTNLMNGTFLPQMARTYDCGLVDVRTMWEAYLRGNDLEPADLLSDRIHLNDRGSMLMAGLVSRYLVPRDDLPAPAETWVREYIVGRDVTWEAGRLTLRFRGNRVDVATATAGEGEATRVEVRIDGKPPGALDTAYVFTRPSTGPANIWPAIKRVTAHVPLIAETWTVTLRDVNDAADAFRFRVEGSVTGLDGEGELISRSDWPRDEQGEPVEPPPFVSDSGRMVIRPSDWTLARERAFSGVAVPEGFEVRIEAAPQFAALHEAGSPTMTLAQGLVNGEHTLEIIGDAGQSPPVRVIRIYEPPLQLPSEVDGGD